MSVYLPCTGLLRPIAKVAASAVLTCCLVLSGARGEIVISEFMAANRDTLLDEDGDASDWIELHNSGTQTVNLAGWYLTDKSNDLTQWALPATNLAAGGFMIVFASGKNRTEPGFELHANFSLKASGEYLALTMPDGVTVGTEYSPSFPPQFENVSYGFSFLSGTAILVAAGAPCRAHVPMDDTLGSNWIFRTGFDDSSWILGTTGVGFDTTPDYLPLIGTDVFSEMYNIHPTVYIRIPFVVDNAAGFSGLMLKMKYDDGFFAYLNGEEIARQYAPESPAWNAAATNFHPDEEALVYEHFSVPDGEELLTVGTNILAIIGMNNVVSSSDLLFLPELGGARGVPVLTDEMRYFSVPTPGVENGAGTADLGPLLSGITHLPAEPGENDDLLILAEVSAAGRPVAAVQLHYRVMYSNEVMAAMLDDGIQDDGLASNGIYGAVIPAAAYTPGQMVRFRVTATDDQFNVSRWPVANDPTEYEGTVVADPTLTNALPVLHWFVPNPGWHIEPWGNNRNESPACLFYRGKFYDNIRVRIRGQTAAGWDKPPYKFEFNKGRYFDFRDGFDPVEEINLNSTLGDKAFVRPVLSFESYRDGGSFWCETFPVRVQQNAEFHSVALFIEQPSARALEHRQLDSRGALYKVNGGNPVVSASDWVVKVLRKNEPNDDLQALVDGVSETNSSAARTLFVFDHVDVASVLNYLAITMIMHDRDCFWKNFYLYRDTEGSGEWSFLPWDKDLTFGRNWTQDVGVLNDNMTFNDPPDQGQFNRLVGAALGDARLMEMYGRRCRTLMDQFLQAPGTPAENLYFEKRIADLAAEMDADVSLDRAKWPYDYGVEQSLAEGIQALTNQYLEPRRDHLYVTNHVSRGGIIPDAPTGTPAIRFGAIEFSPSSGNQDEEYIELINTNAVAVDVSGWALSNAVRYVFKPGTVIESGGALYVSPNAAAFRARASSPKGGEGRYVVGPYSGHLSAWGEALELYDAVGALAAVTNYDGNPSDLQRHLRITEIMYDPRDPPEGSPYEDGFFEFVEFINISSNVLDLFGARFSAGFTFAFTNGITTLDPGSLLVLVRNREAFASRYDTNGMLVVGEYDGRLSNSGERLKLEDPQNETILEFGYSDQWHPETDGGGYSLTVRDARMDHQMWGDSNYWRASVAYDGTPGWDDSGLVDEDGDGLPDSLEIRCFGGTDVFRGGPGDDFDDDGQSNLDEYIAGTNPADPDSRFALEIRGEDDRVIVDIDGLSAAGNNYARMRRYYFLEAAAGIGDHAWTPLAGYTNRVGMDEPISWTNQPGVLIEHFRAGAWMEEDFVR